MSEQIQFECSEVANNKLKFLLRKGAKVVRTVLEIKLPDGCMSTLDSFGRFEITRTDETRDE